MGVRRVFWSFAPVDVLGFVSPCPDRAVRKSFCRRIRVYRTINILESRTIKICRMDTITVGGDVEWKMKKGN